LVAPAGYAHRIDSGNTLVVQPSSESGVMLRFNLNRIGNGNAPASVAENFIRAEAAKRGYALVQLGGKTAMTAKSSRTSGGRTFSVTYWQIAAGDALVDLVADVDESRAGGADVVACLSAIPQMVESIRAK
jgi:hypothetical protein